MTKALMSDAEIRRRKKLQGHISQTTSTLGLTGLGVLGASSLARRGKLTKVPGLRKADPDKLKDKATTIGIISGGVGGLGGYNFAAYTNAESRKRKQLVKKSNTSAFGIVHD